MNTIMSILVDYWLSRQADKVLALWLIGSSFKEGYLEESGISSQIYCRLQAMST